MPADAAAPTPRYNAGRKLPRRNRPASRRTFGEDFAITRIERAIFGLAACAAAGLSLWAPAASGADPTSQPAMAPSSQPAGVYAAWKNGPPSRPDFFPIAVWLQDPKNAPKFQALGVNTYVGLWKGPTEAQLAELARCGMKVICRQNAVGLAHRDAPTIIGWMHGDEPDNAQDIRRWRTPADIRRAWPDAPDRTLQQWGRYGPPIPPKDIVADYERMVRADPTRPVLLNLGQGVAYDDYIGRGYRRGRLEDYPQYLRGADVVSFDIYPAVHARPEIAGKLWYVARGVQRLRNWAGPRQTVWNCIECTHIANPPAIATGRQIRAEVWMSIVHGSRGLIYFVHEFKPKFIEAGLLAHPAQSAAVAAVNRQIAALAAVINSPEAPDAAAVRSSAADAPVAATARRFGGPTYVFAVAMRDKAATATFTLPGPAAAAEVIDENRSLPVTAGSFQDDFRPWDVHLYRIR